MVNAYENKKEYEKQLNDRWSWLTGTIDESEETLNTNLVLENSYKFMVEHSLIEANWLENFLLQEEAEDGEMLTEAPQMRNAVGDYVIPKVMFPIIRRVMPELIANKLVSVQPIQAPTGVIYYISYNYSNTKGSITAGDEFSGNPNQTTPAYATWYSSEKIGPVVIAAEDADDLETGVVCDKVTDFFAAIDPHHLDYSKIVFKKPEVYVTGNKTVKGENVPFTAAVELAKDVKLVGVDSYFGTGKLVLDVADAVVFGDLIDTDTEKLADILAGKDADGETVYSDVNLVVFVVYDQEGTKFIPEMEFGIEHMNISTKERKLKVRWTKEAEQDMMAYHKINVEAELVKVAGIQTNYETDRELMRFIDGVILPRLSFFHDWTNDNPTTGNNASGNYLDRHRALAQKLYAACTKVAEYNHLGPADWAVVSPQVAAVLQMLPDWKTGEINSNKSTFYNAGFLGNGALTVYVDPNRVGAEADQITLGYKSKDSTYGAGVVYSPYANWASNNVVEPDTFNNVRGFFSRYALTLAPRGQYNYARVTIKNLVF